MLVMANSLKYGMIVGAVVDVYYENILMYTCGEIEIGILSVE